VLPTDCRPAWHTSDSAKMTVRDTNGLTLAGYARFTSNGLSADCPRTVRRLSADSPDNPRTGVGQSADCPRTGVGQSADCPRTGPSTVHIQRTGLGQVWDRPKFLNMFKTVGPVRTVPLVRGLSADSPRTSLLGPEM
jgi:hypothetical protein